jgi:hypothetical protein
MSQKTCREGEPARGSLRREAKEIGSQMLGRRRDNDRRRIHCNTLRIVSRRERGRMVRDRSPQQNGDPLVGS